MSSRSTSILTIAGVTVVGGVLAYAVYFDYKRRNDVEFRKKLRKEKKRVDKTLAQSKESLLSASGSAEVTPAALREALEQVKKEVGPDTPEEKEAYFMNQVAMGESLSLRGPDFYLLAAMSFYRALRVYPSPVELIVIYQKTVPEPIFKIVMEMTNLDVSSPPASPSRPISQSIPDELTDEETSPTRGGPPSEASSQEWDKVTDPGSQHLDISFCPTCSNTFCSFLRTISIIQVKSRVEGYYDTFPPKSTNVTVETREGRKVLVASRDFSAGETIYKENPVVAVLDADVQAAGTHCTHCLRLLQSSMSIPLTEEPNLLSSKFCSKACLVANKTQSHSLLFTTEPPLPVEIGSAPVSPEAIQARSAAQADFAEYVKKEGRAAPLLVARFIARQVALETMKMVEGGKKPTDENDFTDAESGEYLLADHIERLRYLEVVPPTEELSLIVKVLQTALPGLEQFVTDERHATLLGKMTYNAFGVCFGGGRDDKPEPAVRPEDVEKSRTPYGTARQIGSALYTVSSYLTHSCIPSARPSFASGTSNLHLVANHDIKQGDVLTVAFVDVTQHTDEPVIECRRRRRTELARGWRFACSCDRCKEEEKTMSVEEKKADTDVQDGSKIEASMSRYEEGTENDNVE
ncbi:hypothetical protein BDZ94DRAFT_1281731 [Collybia nuda]|uniref:SET domain-containing protein n=1 Tax=Collybia nuda TaxID=64659 RepID=A0A9P6CG87_9AGAR|nr:hypothetical protein BDZ94DRAFT_1281731 [Collybia nuda]